MVVVSIRRMSRMSPLAFFQAEDFDKAAKLAVESVEISYSATDNQFRVDKHANKWYITENDGVFVFVVERVALLTSPTHL